MRPREAPTDSSRSSHRGDSSSAVAAAMRPLAAIRLALIAGAGPLAARIAQLAPLPLAAGPQLRVDRGPAASSLTALRADPGRTCRAPASSPPASSAAETRHRSESALSSRHKLTHLAIALLWAVVTTTFWVWWLGHASGGTPWLYWTQTTMLIYQTTVLPSFFWMYVRKMRRPIEVPAPVGMRVAMITLCVPSSESLGVIRKQLEALASVDYPHDSWVLDEGDSAEVRELAEACGVRYFTRRGVARWNQPEPPFQLATKAGNVNAWLDEMDSIGEHYEAFVQMDIDHLPRADYLHRVLGYFTDPGIAWVQAPSVCGNLDNWAARGLAEQDLVFQGPLQMGFYGATETPFIIGSHTTYRTAAIREIGGFQPTRAEDHLDTVMLAAHGYRGVFVPELIAVGDGPHNFATYLRQQFAWAHSMIEIFLRRTPRLIRRYSLGQAFQFLFCQSWYTLWSVSLGLLWILPAVALFADRPIADVGLGEFLLYFLPVPLTSSLMWCATRRWFQPGGVRLSWRGVILEIARWPVVLWALANVVLRIKRDYMITPKGVAGQRGPRASSIYGPYIFLTALPLIAVWSFQASSAQGGVQGYFGLALVNGVLGLVMLQTTLVLEIRELAAGPAGMRAALRMRVGVLACAGALLACLAFSAIAAWTPMISAVS